MYDIEIVEVLLSAAHQMDAGRNGSAMDCLMAETDFGSVGARVGAIARVRDVLNRFDCDRGSASGAARIFRAAAFRDLFSN